MAKTRTSKQTPHLREASEVRYLNDLYTTEVHYNSVDASRESRDIEIHVTAGSDMHTSVAHSFAAICRGLLQPLLPRAPIRSPIHRAKPLSRARVAGLMQNQSPSVLTCPPVSDLSIKTMRSSFAYVYHTICVIVLCRVVKSEKCRSAGFVAFINAAVRVSA